MIDRVTRIVFVGRPPSRYTTVHAKGAVSLNRLALLGATKARQGQMADGRICKGRNDPRRPLAAGSGKSRRTLLHSAGMFVHSTSEQCDVIRGRAAHNIASVPAPLRGGGAGLGFFAPLRGLKRKAGRLRLPTQRGIIHPAAIR